VRTLCCGLLLAVLGVVPAVAQTPNTSSAQNTTTTTETRPGLPTFFGDTGFWFVPTAETLPSGKVSVSAFRANFDRRQGLTDVGLFGVTGAIGLGGRVEVFGSWRLVRLRRAVRSPVFVPSEPDVGGILTEFPYLRRGWSDNLGGPVTAGAKWNLISQSRGDAMSLAPRVVFTFPTGSPWGGTNDWDSRIEVVASREFAQAFEVTGSAGAVLRADPPEFSLSDGVSWGIGASFPSRKPLRALVEWTGEVLLEHDTGVVNPPYTAEDRSIAPLFSPIPYPADLKVGGVWQMSNGLFVHGGFNYSVRSGDTTVPVNREINHHGWGYDVRLGWHPGTRVYVPPPPPAPIVREVIREVPGPAPAPAPAPPANRPPQITVSCDPCTVAPGQSSKVSATATDPDGDPVTYRWTAPQGAFAVPADPNTTWTAPNQVGTVPLTATASDNRGGSASGTVNVQVVRREQIVFEDVHFDFDKYNLRPDALKILDDAITRLQANPDLNVTIEGHCDSIGTNEYNLALGERRSNAVRDYLAMRGIAAGRLRTVSYGEERPIADNGTAAGRAMNRRAHLAVIIQ
jgi:peptidoglycan-associated lipoprotein